MQLNVMVPWMHGFDHDLACQLKHSALYRVSALGGGEAWPVSVCERTSRTKIALSARAVVGVFSLPYCPHACRACLPAFLPACLPPVRVFACLPARLPARYASHA